MPRATRAALRAQELTEEATTATSVALPLTPTKERVPLGEISSNTGVKVEMIVNDHQDGTKKLPAKGKKGKGGKKGKKGTKPKPEAENIEVVEDDYQSSHSDAVDEACEDLINNSTTDADSTLPDRSVSPSSPAVNMATEQISTGHVCDLTTQPDSATVQMPQEMGEETVGIINNAESQSAHSPLSTSGQNAATDDSFVEQIKSRSPAKRVSRIEDSVEALDALEDEIEKVGEAIPATASDISSPTNARKLTKNASHDKAKAVKDTRKASRTAQKGPTLSTKSHATKPNPCARPNDATSKPLHTRTPAGAPKSVNSAPEYDRARQKAQSFAPKRVSSIHKAPFQPTKSTKPPTKSNFELPGDAVARKLKEQREERQKREEEEQIKNRQFKAKSVQKTQAPEVKLTATARARLSLAREANGHAKPMPAPRGTISSGFNPSKRQSTLATTNNRLAQPVKKSGPASANISAKRGPSSGANASSRHPTSPSQPRPAPTAEEISHQKIKGKEVYRRTRQLMSEKESERKEKEEAAKKARSEAAERGRVASREWAEKQKARKLAAQKFKSDGHSPTAATA